MGPLGQSSSELKASLEVTSPVAAMKFIVAALVVLLAIGAQSAPRGYMVERDVERIREYLHFLSKHVIHDAQGAIENHELTHKAREIQEQATQVPRQLESFLEEVWSVWNDRPLKLTVEKLTSKVVDLFEMLEEYKSLDYKMFRPW